LLWELIGFTQNSKLIPLPQSNNFLFLVDGKIHEHLKFFHEHFRLWVVIIMGLNFLQKISPRADHKKRGVCKKLNNVPFLHAPLPSPSILVALQEICHEAGKLLLQHLCMDEFKVFF
jgi:hypothetical protein